ncbi:hypothetical protein [Alysiella crassa]|uniref:Uncharacterized protein n=2 Tax=Alysiella crassa TaxID=153491 RepID=A0A376BUC4_9NEIS|nr:hypothetical protein [Alysiella crassa]UOP06003.1 hypothetical protein LVJ80_09070 [Alysiella crassa]SSY80451.1 Uncharacterised protein [Alysiella crassa]
MWDLPRNFGGGTLSVGMAAQRHEKIQLTTLIFSGCLTVHNNLSQQSLMLPQTYPLPLCKGEGWGGG